MEKDESFYCICRKKFGSMADLSKHWKTNNIATTGRPHYRLVTGGAMDELEGKEVRQMPPVRKDGPQ